MWALVWSLASAWAIGVLVVMFFAGLSDEDLDRGLLVVAVLWPLVVPPYLAYRLGKALRFD